MTVVHISDLACAKVGNVNFKEILKLYTQKEEAGAKTSGKLRRSF
jgi:hypothetical protein